MKLFRVRLELVFAAVILAVSFLAFNYLFSYVESRRPSAMDVRVRIARKRSEAVINSSGRYEIKGFPLEEKPSSLKVVFSEDKLFINGNAYQAQDIEIVALSDEGLSLDEVVYRGNIRLLKQNDSFDVINVVGIEDYLKGVVPKEVYSFWPQAAIRAQAIAARSYAVYRAFQREGKGYDLRADATSQVYGGKSAEALRTSRAVDETNGKVLEYDGKIFPAYFHACCGGHTESSKVLWNEPLAPLDGVRCRWCRFSPYYSWSVTVSPGKMLSKISAIDPGVKRIDDIKLGEVDSSGRADTVKVRSASGWTMIKVSDLRREIGREKLKSSKFVVHRYPFFYVFKGHGWGHGVGMCQWGAMGMAVMLQSTRTILRKYYPGTKIVDIRELL